MSIIEGTVDLTEHFPSSPAAVFAAWSTEQAQRTWGDPGDGWEMSFDRFSFAVGETDICRFGPTGGQRYINENRYLAVEPEKRIVYSTTLHSDDALSFAGTVVVTFEQTADGTRMRLVEQGLHLGGQDDRDGHRAGWEGMIAALGSYLRDHQ